MRNQRNYVPADSLENFVSHFRPIFVFWLVPEEKRKEEKEESRRKFPSKRKKCQSTKVLMQEAID